MATLPTPLTLATYLQRWDPAARTLTVHVLVVPTGDPRAPLSTGFPSVPASPSFAGAGIVLEARLSSDPFQLPTLDVVPASGELFTLAVPPDQRALFDAMAARLAITRPPVASERKLEQTLRKYLPESYRGAFGFVAARTELAVTDDSYHCALRCPPTKPPPGPPTRDMSWGEALAVMLRQPVMARALGLVHTVTIAADARYESGGWLFFTLAAGSDFSTQVAADPAFVRTFATRVPALGATGRPIFTPVLFPVAADATAAAALGNFDEVFVEAARFDDGFAKIVHAAQPRTSDPLDEGEKGMPPVRDEGMLLGWDDEDILIGQNRSAGFNPDGTLPPEAPRGIAGYRVDVRRVGQPTWSSRCAVEATALAFDGIAIGGFAGELNVEVHPNRTQDRFWLPQYFARYKGRSLVIDNVDDRTLSCIDDPRPDLYAPIGADAVPLLYGERYEVRVRLADATGGGPTSSTEAFNAGEAPVATWHFRRYVPPAQLRVDTLEDARRFSVRRPLIGYPQAVFTGAPSARARLLAIAAANRADPTNLQEIAIADSDVLYIEIRVLVRQPGFDPSGNEADHRVLYTTHRAFPGDPDAALALELRWVDCGKLDDVAWEVPTRPPGTVSGPIDVPTARDVRVELRGVGRNDLVYFGNERARRGALTALMGGSMRVLAESEPTTFRSLLPERAIASAFLQPETGAPETLVTRLAGAVALATEGGTLLGEAGTRAVFAAWGVNHHVPADRSSLSFTSPAELARKWVNVIRLTVDRDWSWQGQADPAFVVRRTIRTIPGGTTTSIELGGFPLHHVVNRHALIAPVDRSRVELVLVDSFVPVLEAGRPCELEVTYTVQARLANGRTEEVTLANHLPVVTPPRQVPRIVSAGHAFSEYQASEAYSSTAPRRRMLWIELAEAPEDPRDNYFARVLASAPDPLLLPDAEPAPDPIAYPASAVDSELIRVVRPGQFDDFAGLSAMQRMIPAADSDRHYLLPLPPNVATDAAELFGFFTYEICVGHDRGSTASPFWSTAQGRFGTAVRVEGVQHPAPTLHCSVWRDTELVTVSAPHAVAVVDGQRVLTTPPGTEIWIALYAQVHQADGATRRNVQLDLRRTSLRERRPRRESAPTALVGYAQWRTSEVMEALRGYSLREDAPLSVLAIELLPEPNGHFADPLGADLGQVRILRASPLTPVATDCC